MHIRNDFNIINIDNALMYEQHYFTFPQCGCNTMTVEINLNLSITFEIINSFFLQNKIFC